MSEVEFPKWEDMPKPTPMLVLSWEDLYEKLADRTRKEFGRDPTKDEAKEVMHEMLNMSDDALMETFWDLVDITIDYHKFKDGEQ